MNVPLWITALTSRLYYKSRWRDLVRRAKVTGVARETQLIHLFGGYHLRIEREVELKEKPNG